MCHLVVCFKDGTHIHPDIAFLGMLPVEKEKKTKSDVIRRLPATIFRHNDKTELDIYILKI
jgi:hypothetical protein